MAHDAHAMLRSRDFGSSGSSEEGGDEEDYRRQQQQQQQEEEQEEQYARYPDESINNTTDPTTGQPLHSLSTSSQDESQLQSQSSYIDGHQTGVTNLASFEASFVPPEDHHHHNHYEDTKPRPKTPSAKEVQQKQRRVISDAAGFTRHAAGPRDIFATREEGGLVDMSQHDVNAAASPSGYERERQRRGPSRQSRRSNNDNNSARGDDEDENNDEGNGTSGLNDQPSFERSDSQSMRVETVTTRRGGGGGGKGGNARETDTSRQAKAVSKQQLTLREQEKVRLLARLQLR